jgi:hypothetical protein
MNTMFRPVSTEQKGEYPASAKLFFGFQHLVLCQYGRYGPGGY